MTKRNDMTCMQHQRLKVVDDCEVLTNIYEVNGPERAFCSVDSKPYVFRVIKIAGYSSKNLAISASEKFINMVVNEISAGCMSGDIGLLIWRLKPQISKYGDDTYSFRMRLCTVPELETDQWREIVNTSVKSAQMDGMPVCGTISGFRTETELRS
ncbi:MAG: hypothetical protein N0E44_18165 [Candidatus Thiodiazotropha lotti]|nr:hypothetical protein [Candidatus Thiodiazotropha lotti]MCW4221809.1 hypothetical protein [Candidatus Thiodiazotropha lotti]